MPRSRARRRLARVPRPTGTARRHAYARYAIGQPARVPNTPWPASKSYRVGQDFSRLERWIALMIPAANNGLQYTPFPKGVIRRADLPDYRSLFRHTAKQAIGYFVQDLPINNNRQLFMKRRIDAYWQHHKSAMPSPGLDTWQQNLLAVASPLNAEFKRQFTAGVADNVLEAMYNVE